MEIRHLRYFLAVADLRNFTKAAEASFVAQSALSQQIGRLEAELGAPLFTRGKRGAELTPAGELLLPHARRLVADEARARAEMRSYLGLEKGRLKVGLIQTSSSACELVSPIAEFHGRHPGIEIHISNSTSAQMIEGVQRGDLDLAVVGVGPDELPEGVEGLQLATDPLVGVICEKEAGNLVGPVSVAGLVSRGRLIQFAPGTGIRKHVDRALRRAGVEAPSAFEMTQATDMMRFAVLGLGVTIVPRALTEASRAEMAALKHPYLVFGLTDAQAVHPVTVIYEPTRLSVSARELANVFVAASGHKTDRLI